MPEVKINNPWTASPFCFCCYLSSIPIGLQKRCQCMGALYHKLLLSDLSQYSVLTLYTTYNWLLLVSGDSSKATSPKRYKMDEMKSRVGPGVALWDNFDDLWFLISFFISLFLCFSGPLFFLFFSFTYFSFSLNLQFCQFLFLSIFIFLSIFFCQSLFLWLSLLDYFSVWIILFFSTSNILPFFTGLFLSFSQFSIFCRHLFLHTSPALTLHRSL